MKKLNFDMDEYQALPDTDKLDSLKEIFFKYLDKEKITQFLSDEQIEDIYYETLNRIQLQFLLEYEESNANNVNKLDIKIQGRLLPTDISEYHKLFLLHDELSFRKYDRLTEKNEIRTDTRGYIVFIEFKKFIINTIEKHEAELTIVVPENKIISKLTNLQAIGYLFTELIKKGLIQPKFRNGNINQLGTARMILEHYHFQNLDKQPSVENIRKTLFDDNQLSEDKAELFEFPTLKQLNSK